MLTSLSRPGFSWLVLQLLSPLPSLSSGGLSQASLPALLLLQARKSLAPPKLPALRLDLLHQAQEECNPNTQPAQLRGAPLSARGLSTAAGSFGVANEASEGWLTDRPSAARQVRPGQRKTSCLQHPLRDRAAALIECAYDHVASCSAVSSQQAHQNALVVHQLWQRLSLAG